MLNEEEFLRDVSNHEMHIIKDDGLYRHLRFKRPGTSVMYFDLIAWPDRLCYTGDMGTYVFSRLEDMFQFFRADRERATRHGHGLAINLGYWSEKVLSGDRSGRGNGIKEFSIELARKSLKEYVRDYADPPKNERSEFHSDLRDSIYYSEDEWEFVEAVRNYRSKHLCLSDFLIDANFDEYTHHFVWCCYALAWGIQKYDEHKNDT